MESETRIDRIQKAMFSNPEEGEALLSPKDMELKRRYEKAFTHWLTNPQFEDKQIVRFIMNECGVSRSIAYEDIKVIRSFLGNVKLASKEWYRHMVIEMCRKAYRIAEARNDSKGMALAADKIGKYTKLDKDEAEALPWDMLIPPNFEPDPDPTVLGLSSVDNIEEKRLSLRSKYLSMYDPKYVQDAVLVVNEQDEDEPDETD